MPDLELPKAILALFVKARGRTSKARMDNANRSRTARTNKHRNGHGGHVFIGPGGLGVVGI
jgi:hypothetical protein